MYQHRSLDDTIAAIATPTGQGGIGIVRVSGAQAFAIADAVFRPKNNKKPSSLKSFTAAYGWVVKDGQTIDEALLTVFRGPKSYTAQDVVEISCHAGSAVVRAVLDIILTHGARLAEPGEFTKRAFLNGRIDLTQAEAVLDIIHAKTEHFARLSQNQLKGELSLELESIRAELMSAYTMVEALINFPEDGLDTSGHKLLLGRLDQQIARITKLLDSSRNGLILRQGIRLVICGKPNVGKSSLLNVLLKQDRAIVTHIAGTTRDVIEESAQIKGVPFQLVDTAGILEPRDLIEEEAIKRSHASINSADVALLVLDGSLPLDRADLLLVDQLKGRKVLYVINKSDLEQRLDETKLQGAKIIKVSALTKSSIEELETAILGSVWQGSPQEPQGIVINNIRHVYALTAAQEHLVEAKQMMKDSASFEFISQNIKDAVNRLDSITGRNIDEDLLDKIFSEFCIGK